MTALVIAEHDHASIKGATLAAVAVAAACAPQVHILVAGHQANAAAAAAAQVAGVSQVIHADGVSYWQRSLLAATPISSSRRQPQGKMWLRVWPPN